MRRYDQLHYLCRRSKVPLFLSGMIPVEDCIAYASVMRIRSSPFFVSKSRRAVVRYKFCNGSVTVNVVDCLRVNGEIFFD